MTFDASSTGQLATVIYEWGDVGYLGKDTSTTEDLPVSTRLLPTAYSLNVQHVENLYLHVQCQEGGFL